jgi:hypothetical protein
MEIVDVARTRARVLPSLHVHFGGIVGRLPEKILNVGTLKAGGGHAVPEAGGKST